jgi:hypothetical protein
MLSEQKARSQVSTADSALHDPRMLGSQLLQIQVAAAE